ncbi:ENR1 protein, partial [Picathartes gymnocephalus]|nr:ENR1 protein [Picathartes gymnocephalus]
HEQSGLYECQGRNINPFWGIRQISNYWEFPQTMNEKFWEAPDNLFWICGNRAYTKLPADWTGSCTIGIIKLAFFLLPKGAGSSLGVPV